MKIIGISGSLRKDSYTTLVLSIAMRNIADADVKTEIIDLRDFHLPFCDGGTDYPAYPDVARLRQTFKSADGILVATPEYHGSISGVLKNALDLIDLEHVDGKVFGLVAVLGGPASTNSLNTLRIICRQLHAWVLPEQVIIEHAKEAFDEKGELRDQRLSKRLEDLVKQLRDIAGRLKAKEN
jgi:FMN reductase